MRKNILIVFSTIICFSCNYNDKFYFDIENQTINSCSSKGLKSLSCKSDSLKLAYFLKWEGDINHIPESIKLENLPDGYIIDEYILNEQWEKGDRIVKKIMFAKSASYEIEIYR